MDVGWVDLRLVDPDIANLIGLDFDSQFVVGFVAACVEGFLGHVGERSDKSKFGLLGRDIFPLIGVGEGGGIPLLESPKIPLLESRKERRVRQSQTVV